MNQTRAFVFFAVTLTAVVAFAQSKPESDAGPRIGDAPPALDIAKYVQAPADAPRDWAGLKGNVVVLEFWATWCGPCVMAIPHLNELAEKFKDQPVRFISIAGETEEEKVASFVSRRPLKGWLALDNRHATAKAFDVTGIPHTVIVDAQGKIAAMTRPESVTAESLQRVLAGEPAGLAQPLRMPPPPPRAPSSQPAWITFRIGPPADWRAMDYYSGGGKLRLRNCGLKDAMERAHQLPAFRVAIDPAVSPKTFDVEIEVPGADEAAVGAILTAALEAKFGLRTRWEIRKLDAYALRVGPGGKPLMAESAMSAADPAPSTHTQNSLRFMNWDMKHIATTLSTQLGALVVDDTGLAGRFDGVLPHRFRMQNDVVIAELSEKSGLLLEPIKTSVEVLVIEPAVRESPAIPPTAVAP